MRFRLSERTPGEIDPGLLFGGIAVAALLAFALLPVPSFMPACVWRGLTGVPCPTCGTTRSLLHLSHGEILASLILNPLACGALMFLVFLFFASVLSRLAGAGRIELLCTEREMDSLRIAGVALFVLNWAYVALYGTT